MSLTLWFCEKLRAYAEKKAVTKGDAIKKVIHENGTINVSYVDPDNMERHYGGESHTDAALYFGENANESWIDYDPETGEAVLYEDGEKTGGQVIHRQEFKSLLRADAADKFFSDGLKQRVMWAVYASVGAMMTGMGAIAMVVQYGG